jgi:LysM repeat protein
MYYGQYIYPNQKLDIWVPETSLFADQKEERPPELSTGENYHIVTEGETLWDIAQHYDITIEKLKLWNHKRSNMIKPGDRLIVRNDEGSF